MITKFTLTERREKLNDALRDVCYDMCARPDDEMLIDAQISLYEDLCGVDECIAHCYNGE